MFHKSIYTERGFTIIELLTVLVIIGVLTTISMVAYNGVRHKARLGRVKTNVSEIVISLDGYSSGHNGKFPALTVYHNNLPPSGSYTTTPAPPQDPTSGVPVTLKWMGNAIIGGGPPLVDNGNPLQDDFYQDMAPSPPDTISMFRQRQNEFAFGNGPMNIVDQLALAGEFETYPVNPLKGPGIPMVNIAHMLYIFDTGTNDFQWVDFTLQTQLANGEVRTGLCAARPSAEGVYEPIEIIWDELSYPQGDFAYIPFNLTSAQGKYCDGYWIIAYGDLGTFENSPYNKFALDRDLNYYDSNFANWPNLPPPYGDGLQGTPPVQGTVEFEIKRLVQGALDIRATAFEDQLTIIEEEI